MPQLSSPLSTPAGMPLVNAAHLAKAAGLYMQFGTLAELHAAVAAEGANWPDGQRLACAEEAATGAVRIYRTSLGHARTAQIGARRILLSADSSIVRLVSGSPSSGLGANGDGAVDTATGRIYTKAAGVWSVVGAPVLSGVPVITGTPQVGNVAEVTLPTATADPTRWRYVYKRNGVVIDGAVDAGTYAYVLADEGAVITVDVYASNANGESLPATSAPTSVVAAAAAETPLAVPASTAQLFDEYVADATPTYAVAFGSQAQALPALEKSHVVNSLNAVTAAFRMGNDFTGATKINSEAQTYLAAPSNATHRIGLDRLGLWAVLQPGEEWHVPFDSQINTALPAYLNGTATPWANLPNSGSNFELFNALGTAEVGQWIGLINRGVARIAAIDPGVSITLAPVSVSSTSNFSNAMMALLPIQSTVCTTYTQGQTTMTFPANTLSTKIKPGWSVGRVDPGGDSTKTIQMSTDVRVVSIDRATGVVVVNKSIPYGDIPGSRVVFWPCIEAGQVWTKELFDIRPDGSLMAVEWDVDIFPGFSTAAAADLPRTGSRHDLRSTLINYPDIPAGAWPALWGYSGDDGSVGVNGTSEMDPMELFMSLTMGNRLYSTGNVGGGASLYDKTTGGWTVTGDGKNRMPQTDGISMVGRHKVQYVYGWEPTDPGLPEDPETNPLRPVSWHYLDGELIHKETFPWLSDRPVQLAMNMAMGWMSRSGVSNFQFPFRTSNFERANMDLLSLKVWCRSGDGSGSSGVLMLDGGDVELDGQPLVLE